MGIFCKDLDLKGKVTPDVPISFAKTKAGVEVRNTYKLDRIGICYYSGIDFEEFLLNCYSKDIVVKALTVMSIEGSLRHENLIGVEAGKVKRVDFIDEEVARKLLAFCEKLAKERADHMKLALKYIPTQYAW